MSQLARASAWLSKTMASHNSSGSESARKVYFLHGANRIEIDASFDSVEIETTDTDGQLTTERIRVFLVNTNELTENGQPFEPTMHDRLLEELTTGSTKQSWLFDVVKLPGQGCFDYVDNHRHRIKVFSRLSANQTANVS